MDTGSKEGWWMNARIYELYIDKFAGDLRGLAGRMEYFTDLGIDCLHILPHYPSPMVDDGYDISDFRGVRVELGNLDDFRAMIKAAHDRGIKIIIDFVLNHVSTEHPWFAAARTRIDAPERDYFLWSTDGSEFKDAMNAFPDIKPSNWIKNDLTGDFYFATFYPEQPDLNWDNMKVRQEMFAIMEYWIAIGVDGFRLDAARHLMKRDGTSCMGIPETHEVLKWLRARLEKNHPHIALLAEVNSPVDEAMTYFGNGDECHMLYHFPLMKEFWVTLATGDRQGLDDVLARSYPIPEGCTWATFLRNHDEITLESLEPTLAERVRAFLDPNTLYPFNNGTYASVRIGTVFDGDNEKIMRALSMLYKAPGAPIMYYGDEIGMQNLPPTAGIIDTRKYVRGAFDWGEMNRQRANDASLYRRVVALMKDMKEEGSAHLSFVEKNTHIDHAYSAG